jgi:outer membrane protein
MLRNAFLIILLMSTCSVVFAASGKEVLNLAGVGAIISTSPYDGVKTKTMALPFFSGEYKDFYIQGIEAGYRFFKNEDWTLSAVISPRFMGYSSEDSAALRGMEDRKRSLDAGFKADYALPWNGLVVGGKVLADTLSRSDGIAYELSLRRPVQGSIFRLVPSVGMRYQTRSMVDYYYGVRDGEALAGRSVYAPHGEVNPFVDVIFSCGISKDLVIVMMLGIESLGSEIRKSPIVDESYVLSAGAGLTYRF